MSDARMVVCDTEQKAKDAAKTLKDEGFHTILGPFKCKHITVLTDGYQQPNPQAIGNSKKGTWFVVAHPEQPKA